MVKVIARLYLLKREEGGRHISVASGYRPSFYFGSKQSDGAIFLEDRDRLWPGEECEAHIVFTHPEAFGDTLRPDASFEVKEGLKVVGRGTILGISRN